MFSHWKDGKHMGKGGVWGVNLVAQKLCRNFRSSTLAIWTPRLPGDSDAIFFLNTKPLLGVQTAMLQLRWHMIGMTVVIVAGSCGRHSQRGAW
jgi:hypothetical protein